MWGNSVLNTHILLWLLLPKVPNISTSKLDLTGGRMFRQCEWEVWIYLASENTSAEMHE